MDLVHLNLSFYRFCIFSVKMSHKLWPIIHYSSVNFISGRSIINQEACRRYLLIFKKSVLYGQIELIVLNYYWCYDKNMPPRQAFWFIFDPLPYWATSNQFLKWYNKKVQEFQLWTKIPCSIHQILSWSHDIVIFTGIWVFFISDEFIWKIIVDSRILR